MLGIKQPPKLITPEEAITLFEYTTLDEMHIAKSLYDIFEERKMKGSDVYWNLLTLLTFLYITGRIQGIREERAKRK